MTPSFSLSFSKIPALTQIAKPNQLFFTQTLTLRLSIQKTALHPGKLPPTPADMSSLGLRPPHVTTPTFSADPGLQRALKCPLCRAPISRVHPLSSPPMNLPRLLPAPLPMFRLPQLRHREVSDTVLPPPPVHFQLLRLGIMQCFCFSLHSTQNQVKRGNS